MQVRKRNPSGETNCKLCLQTPTKTIQKVAFFWVDQVSPGPGHKARWSEGQFGAFSYTPLAGVHCTGHTLITKHGGLPGIGFGVLAFEDYNYKKKKNRTEQDITHAALYACSLGGGLNFVNLAYAGRLMYSWEGRQHFAITGEDACQLSHVSLSRLVEMYRSPPETQKPL